METSNFFTCQMLRVPIQPLNCFFKHILLFQRSSLTMAPRIRFLKCYNSGELFFFLLSVNEEVTSTKVVTFVITCQVILGKAKLSIFTA